MMSLVHLSGLELHTTAGTGAASQLMMQRPNTCIVQPCHEQRPKV